MENSTLSKRTVSFGIALAMVCVINAIIVVVKERSETVMGEMKKVTGHHWTTHSIVVIVLFLGLGALFSAMRGGHGVDVAANRLIGAIFGSVVAATVIIMGFYLFVD